MTRGDGERLTRRFAQAACTGLSGRGDRIVRSNAVEQVRHDLGYASG
jgi:hypothetical protein